MGDKMSKSEKVVYVKNIGKSPVILIFTAKLNLYLECM